ncbi:tyrosine-type recombinase/integrase [Vibrio alginolyticus]|uniref:tyrosine-type recombinase/integrase n=1 Tax=Vibrio alginolyticus TaxID=663 RepID=UPI003D0E5E7D
MNSQQIKSIIKNGIEGRYQVDSNLYLRISKSKSASWTFRYKINGKRKELTLGNYGSEPEGMPLVKAKAAASNNRVLVKEGIDPKIHSQRTPLARLQTVDQLATDWLKDCEKRLKHPQIPERVYKKDISPLIGELPVEQVNARDILAIIRDINESGRPTISNDALGYCKQLFNHAIKLDLIQTNPALAFKISDAGGIEKSRERALTIEEIGVVFNSMKENHDSFVRDNYLACIILLCLGVRKGELLSARWNEFDLNERVWRLPQERSKNGIAIIYPLHPNLIDIFEELKVRSTGSDFVFPNRRKSKRYQHVSPDTLNAALASLFKKGKLQVDHFTLHDLRRTFRTQLSNLKVAPHVAERCLNHKLPRIMATYDHHDYFEERKEAHEKLVEHLWPVF